MDNGTDNVKDIVHTRNASFHSKDSEKFKEQNGLKKAKKISENYRLKPYPIEEYLTAEYSRHLQNILCHKTQKNIHFTQYQNKPEYNLLQRQKQSPFFYPIVKVSSSNQPQNTKFCSFSDDEVHQTNKYHNQDNNFNCSLPNILSNPSSLQTTSTNINVDQKCSDYNSSPPAQQYMLPSQQENPQKRRHQQPLHHRWHHYHHNHHHQQEQQYLKQRIQIKPVALHNHLCCQSYIQHPSLYDIYNHDMYKSEEASTSCRCYKCKLKEQFSSSKPFQFSAPSTNQSFQNNSYNSEAIQHLLLTQQEPYYNITAIHDAEMSVPTEYSVKRHRFPLAKFTEPTRRNPPCTKIRSEPTELYGNLLEAGLIPSQTVSSGLTKESIKEPVLDVKKDSTTPQKDGSLQQYSNANKWREYKAVYMSGLKIVRISPVMYTSENDAKMEAILPILNKECLTLFPALLIQKLYDGKQCSTCGARSSVIDQEHMDKHFRQNELKTERKFKKCRNLYEDDSPNIEEQLQKHTKDFKPEERQDAKKPQLIPGVNDVCSVCKESFTQFYNQEDEEWQLKDAVVLDDQYFHEICSEDRNNM